MTTISDLNIHFSEKIKWKNLVQQTAAGGGWSRTREVRPQQVRDIWGPSREGPRFLALKKAVAHRGRGFFFSAGPRRLAPRDDQRGAKGKNIRFFVVIGSYLH